MPGTTKPYVVNGIELKGPRCKHKIEPYNKFSIQYPVTETPVATGEKKRVEGERTLFDPRNLGLNPAWLHTRRAPVDQAVSEAHKATIRSLHPKFPYWGHLIYNSIKEFNASSPNRCRKLVYDLRHGEADHNAWKKLFKEQNQEKKWTKNPEYKRYPIIKHEGKEYCIIDPPLTEKGKMQARGTKKRFLQLKEHMFPMPKRAYVSPLLRAMQTFEYALGRDPEYGAEHARGRALKEIIVRPENSRILNKLREQETGNGADILIDEYVSRSKKPPKAGTNGKDKSYMEEDEDVQKRAASLDDQIFGMDDSDCIVRVTHSLLIQHNLKRLEYGGRKVLQKFMLAEGGLFAYVIEGDRPKKKSDEELRNTPTPETVTTRTNSIEKRMGERRKSAFQTLDARATPVPVTIERAILAM